MTREERENALHCLKVMIDEEVCEECNLYGTTGTDHCEADCVRVAIKALEQEPILDKIRAEIAHLTIAEGGDDYVRKMAELFSFKVKVLQIIDKYKAESEVEDGNDD